MEYKASTFKKYFADAYGPGAGMTRIVPPDWVGKCGRCTLLYNERNVLMQIYKQDGRSEEYMVAQRMVAHGVILAEGLRVPFRVELMYSNGDQSAIIDGRHVLPQLNPKMKQRGLGDASDYWLVYIPDVLIRQWLGE